MLKLLRKYPQRALLAIMLVLCAAFFVGAMGTKQEPQETLCAPTPPDEMGPFYRPGSPVRSTIGTGYFLRGQVLSNLNCQPVPAALIEFWQAGPNGHYADKYRATIIADQQGRYQLETDAPPPYVSRPPHIHIRISADGFETLVTQHYLQKGEDEARFDLVLIPSP